MMRKNLPLSGAIILALALLASTGCGGGGTPTGLATIRGTVVDDGTLGPVAGATVSVGTATVQTDAQGSFEVEAQSGTRTLTINADGYDELQATVTLSEGVNDAGARYLRPSLEAGRGAASGTVRRNGNATAGATIRSGDAEAVSRGDGIFNIYNLAAGSRALTAVSDDGQATGFSVVDVQAGSKTSGVTINLGLAPPAPPVL
ncbi:MAG: carboxypeptidase regulatory-like domain-containing protein [Armatimonadota bacterium]